MTIKEKTRLAKQARKHGHYKTNSSVYVFCPLCRAKVEEDYSMWSGTVNEHLDRAMFDHLEDHDG